MTSNETSVHSAFLADLLNPKGLHHMGDTFLRLFTNEFLNGMSFSTETAIVERENISDLLQPLLEGVWILS